MERYELIEKYPGSPELGTIVKKDNHGQFISTNSPLHILSEEDVKNYPKNWKKLYSEDFLILSYWQPEALVILTESTARSTDMRAFRERVKKGEVVIQSVKRLSDGSVFSVGSYYHPDGVTDNVGCLSKIEFCDPGYIRFEGVIKTSKKWYVGISDLVSVDKPLFSTEDGYAIYPKQTFYTVRSKSGDILSKPEAHAWFGKFMEGEKPLGKSFKKKEAAQEYIILNTPSLTPAQAFSLIKGFIDEDKREVAKSMLVRKIKNKNL